MKEKDIIDEETKEMIQEYSLKQLKEEKIGFEEFNLLVCRFEEYEIKGNYLIGKGKRENIILDDSKLFKKEETLSLILDMYNVADCIYDNTENILEYYKTASSYNKRLINKPSFNLNLKEIFKNKKIYNKMIKFFNKYGMPTSEIIERNDIYKLDLNIYIRRLLDFYYTFNLWQELSQTRKISKKTFEEFGIILDPYYRINEEEKLYVGIVNNIQEKGLFGEEKKKYQVFEQVYYNTKLKLPQIRILATDYITLAYYQLSRVIVNKPQGIPFRKCDRPGCNNFFTYRDKKKKYCDDIECFNIRNLAKVQKFRGK